MDQHQEVSSAKVMLILRIAMVALAALLVGCFFLPWGSAIAEFRDAAAQMPEAWFYEPAGLTAADAVDLSLMEYAASYQTLEGALRDVYVSIMYAAVALPAIALLFAALGKPVPASIFAVLTLAVTELLRWDFGDRGVLPSASHDWGIAPTVYMVAAIVLIALGIASAVLKHRVKKAKAAAAV